MAQYNEILAGRFNRTMQKLFGMKGPASVNELSSIVQPNYNFAGGNELRYLEAWDRFARGMQVGPVAAQNNGIRIRNPLGSGVIAVVESIFLSELTAVLQLVTLGGAFGGAQTLTDLTSLVTTYYVPDSRGRSGGSCILSTMNNTAGLPAPIFNVVLAASANLELLDLVDDQLVLLPGSAIEVFSGTVNHQLNCTFAWRERALEESELR